MAVALALAAATVGADPRVEIYPSGTSVPENLLRIELRFSTPLHPPLTTRNLTLLDANGIEINDAFLDLVLPSSDDKRVTVLFHPGRVKTGIGANLALGRALHTGARVTLVIQHPALAKPVYKTWRVTPFDSQSPQPARWTFALPHLGSRAPLVVHLDKPISSTAEEKIAIRAPDGERLAGNGRLESGETVWRFTPLRPWQPGSYSLVTHPDLEDLAGNRPCSPFEVKTTEAVSNDSGTVQRFDIPN